MFKALFVLTFLLSACPLGAEVVCKTPPLSTWDFQVAQEETGGTGAFSRVEEDLTLDFEQVTGIITATATTSNPLHYAFRFENLTPGTVSIDAAGRYCSLKDGTAKVKVSTPCLSRVISFPASITGTDITYNAGTLGAHIMARNAELMEGKSSDDATKSMFTNRNEATGVYQWNSSCWAYPVDLTCMAPWRDKQGAGSSDSSNHLWPVIAITPRHIVCGHVGTWVGESYHFFARDNQVITRRVTAKMPIVSGTPYYVAVLDEDLPATIRPAKLMPSGFLASYLPGAGSKPIPVIATDQEKKAIANAMWRVNSLVYCTDEGAFAEEIIGGDSSSPVFVEIEGQTVLLTSWWYGGGGAGWDYSARYSELCAALDALHGGESPYYPAVVDLSNFARFDG